MKAGILSLYYNNANYGGLLQAYALTTALNKLGVDGEQICYDAKNAKNPLHGTELGKKEKIKKYGIKYIFFMIGDKCKKKYRRYKLANIPFQDEQKQLIEKRIQALKVFEQQTVLHSDRIYNDSDIRESATIYDAFVCGSDQIWNPSFIRDEYLLKFVPEGKKKIAYAASISRNSLTDGQRDYICEALKDFDAISVREKTAVSLLSSGNGGNAIECMPDPTFLLEEQDWNNLIEKEGNTNIPSEDYILCYFLGDSVKQRKIVKEMAQKRNLKIVSFPHVLGNLRYADAKFGCDQEEYECSPAQFINLIKHAKYVATDSFHATVFSIIYKREFIVFHREKTSYGNSMISRLTDLLDGCGLGARLVGNSAKAVATIMSAKCDFSVAEKKLAERRKQGMDFLENAMK